MCGIDGAILHYARSVCTERFRKRGFLLHGRFVAASHGYGCGILLRFQRRWRGSLCILVDVGGLENEGWRWLYLIYIYTFTTSSLLIHVGRVIVLCRGVC